jgi:hypothetical protein
MKRTLTTILMLTLLLSLLPSGFSLAQSDEVWFNVMVEFSGENTTGTLYITVDANGKAQGQGYEKFQVTYAEGMNLSYEGQFNKVSGTLSGSFLGAYTDSLINASTSSTLQLQFTDMRNLQGTYTQEYSASTQAETQSGTNIGSATGQADKDVMWGATGEETETPRETANPEDSNMRIKEIAAKGEVIIRRAGSDKEEPADLNTVINVGDTIIAKKGGALVKLNSYDDSELMLRPGTELTIKGKQKITTFGEALLRLGKQLSDWSSSDYTNEDFEIETNRANTSIKGTIVVVKDDGNESSLKVIEGTAEFTDKTSGRTMLVNAGEMIAVTERGLGDIGKFDVDAEMTVWAESESESEGFPIWLIILLVVVAVLTLAVVIILLVKHNKK